MGMPTLIGAGIGAVAAATQGQSPLKGAAIGGALGSGIGALGGAGAAGAASGAGAGLATGTGSAAAGTGIALGDVAASSALPEALQGSTLATGIGSGSGAMAGSELGVGGAGISLSQGATDAAYGFNPVSESVGQGSINNLASYANGTGYDLMAKNPTLWDQMSPYVNVQNLSGAANIYDKFNQPQQRTVAPSGGMSRGQAPQGDAILSLLNTARIPERKRISLI